jgi:hypothetical protein
MTITINEKLDSAADNPGKIHVGSDRQFDRLWLKWLNENTLACWFLFTPG